MCYMYESYIWVSVKSEQMGLKGGCRRTYSSDLEVDEMHVHFGTSNAPRLMISASWYLTILLTPLWRWPPGYFLQNTASTVLQGIPSQKLLNDTPEEAQKEDKDYDCPMQMTRTVHAPLYYANKLSSNTTLY